MVSKFHKGIHDSKGQEINIYTIVKNGKTFNGHYTVPLTSCSEVKYVLLKDYSFEGKSISKN